MNCPNCNETLLMMERSRIEIDYCPSCRGVWLDKGELDKMLGHAEPYSSYQLPDEEGFGKAGKYDPYGDNKLRKKRSFLGDLFDFD